MCSVCELWAELEDVLTRIALMRKFVGEFVRPSWVKHASFRIIRLD